MLSGKKLSLQNALNKFFRAMGKVLQVPTASAYCQAKQKVKAEVFDLLTRSVSQDFYRLYDLEGAVERWHGHRLVGSDGSYLNLPDTPELREAFSVHRNQHQGKDSEQVQGLGMVLFDLPERHWTQSGDCSVAQRGEGFVIQPLVERVGGRRCLSARPQQCRLHDYCACGAG